MNLEDNQEFDMMQFKRDEDEHFFTYQNKEFSIVPLTMEESAVYSDLYKIKYEDEFNQVKTKVSSELSIILYLCKIKKNPFKVEGIKNFIGIERSWEELSIPQRFKLLQKFNDEFIIQLYNASKVNSIEKKQEEAVKNF